MNSTADEFESERKKKELDRLRKDNFERKGGEKLRVASIPFSYPLYPFNFLISEFHQSP